MASGLEKNLTDIPDDDRLRHLDKLSHILDTAFTVPGTNFRFGLTSCRRLWFPPLLDDPRPLGLELLGCFPHTHRTRIDLAAQALAERRQGLNVTLAAVLALIRSQDVVAAGSWQWLVSASADALHAVSTTVIAMCFMTRVSATVYP